MNAERAYWDAQPIIYEYRANEQKEKARDEDMKAVYDARKQKEDDATNDLQQYKTPLDEQKTKTEEEKKDWDATEATLAAKQTALDAAMTAWNNRDQTAGVDNSGLESAKNTAQQEKTDAETANNSQKAKYEDE